MRITYEQLATIITCMSPAQRQCDVTLENEEGDCFAANIRIVNSKDAQAGVLDQDHPLIHIIPTADKRASLHDVDLCIDQIVGERIKRHKLR